MDFNSSWAYYNTPTYSENRTKKIQSVEARSTKLALLSMIAIGAIYGTLHLLLGI